MPIFSQYVVKELSVLVVAGIVLFGGLLGQAQAGDRKIYNGALCQPRGGNMSTYDYHYYRGGLINQDMKAYLLVECPVTRDSSNRGVESWGFSGQNKNTQREGNVFSCTLSLREYSTGQVLDSATAFLKGTSERAEVTKSPRKRGMTYLSLICAIPPRVQNNKGSRLGSYYVVEY